MNMRNEPLLSVLTPVYNGEGFLSECIESVLKQTYAHYEYVIINNCSRDRTLEIASTFAKRDDRIRVHNNNEFVGVIENHNIAFRLISPNSKYCKIVSADDTIFPDCITRMVELAELHASAGIVGSYQQSGKSVLWQGFSYPKAIFAGRDVCRQIFIDGNPSFGFGSPTSLLYRADLVRNTDHFYPNLSPHADTSACFSILRDSDFAFVYQVLCWERTHEQTQSSRSAEINRYSSAYLNDLIQYGPSYLTKDEYERLLQKTLRRYREFLAVNLFRSRGREFWDYHESRFKELGFPISNAMLAKAGIQKILREVVNPEQAVRKLRNTFRV
jgi:glycosyltransferase involved in cell wall biosynthesis